MQSSSAELAARLFWLTDAHTCREKTVPILITAIEGKHPHGKLSSLHQNNLHRKIYQKKNIYSVDKLNASYHPSETLTATTSSYHFLCVTLAVSHIVVVEF